MNNTSLLLSLIIIVPVLVLCGYIYKKDRVDKEPLSLLLALLAGGALAYVPAFVLETWLAGTADSIFADAMSFDLAGVLSWASLSEQVTHDLLVSFIGVALVEAVFMWLALLLLTKHNKNFNCLFDGIIYGAFVALGFVLALNLRCLVGNGWQTIALRVCTSLPSYLFFGVTMGLFYTLWHNRKEAQRQEGVLRKAGTIEHRKIAGAGGLLALSILVPTVIHGFYCFANLFDTRTWQIVLIALVVVLFVVCLLVVRVMSLRDAPNKELAGALVLKKHPDVTSGTLDVELHKAEVAEKESGRKKHDGTVRGLVILVIVAAAALAVFLGANAITKNEPEPGPDIVQPQNIGIESSASTEGDAQDDKADNGTVDNAAVGTDGAVTGDSKADADNGGTVQTKTESAFKPAARNGGDSDTLSIGPDHRRSFSYLSDEAQFIYDSLLEMLRAGETAIEFSYDGMDIDEVIDILNEGLQAFTYDFPEYFWIDGGFSIRYAEPTRTSEGYCEFTPTEYEFWALTADKAGAKKALDDQVKKVADEARAYKTEYEQVKFVHDYLSLLCAYDFDGLAEAEKTVHDAECMKIFTPYGCLVEGDCVCNGYAKALQLVLDELGIECIYVCGPAGTGSDTELHAWNIVKVDGDYCYIDVTWDDSLDCFGYRDAITYTYFLLPDEEMLVDHTPEMEAVSLPSCAATGKSFYRHNGLLLDTYDKSAAIKALDASRNKLEMEPVSVQFASKRAYDKALQGLFGNGDIAALDWLTDSAMYSVDEEHCILYIFEK